MVVWITRAVGPRSLCAHSVLCYRGPYHHRPGAEARRARAEMKATKLVYTVAPDGRPVLRWPLRDRLILWLRVGVVLAVTAALTGSSAQGPRTAVIVACSAVVFMALGAERLHSPFGSGTAATVAIRWQVAHNPSLAYLIPAISTTGVLAATDRGLAPAGLALVVALAGAFTWLAWESSLRLATRSQRLHRWLTRWNGRVIDTTQRRLDVADLKWKTKQW